MERELTAIETTRRLGITLDNTYRLLYAGKLPGRKDAKGRWLVPAAAVEERLARRRSVDDWNSAEQMPPPVARPEGAA